MHSALSEGVCGGVSPVDLAELGRCLSSLDLLGFDFRSYVCLNVGSFRSTLLIIGDGCYSYVLIIRIIP